MDVVVSLLGCADAAESWEEMEQVLPGKLSFRWDEGVGSISLDTRSSSMAPRDKGS